MHAIYLRPYARHLRPPSSLWFAIALDTSPFPDATRQTTNLMLNELLVGVREKDAPLPFATRDGFDTEPSFDDDEYHGSGNGVVLPSLVWMRCQ